MAPMEILVFVVLVGIVAVLAMRFGQDSRQSVYSKEEELGQCGITHSPEPTTKCEEPDHIRNFSGDVAPASTPRDREHGMPPRQAEALLRRLPGVGSMVSRTLNRGGPQR